MQIRVEIVKNYEERHTKPDQGALCEEDLELIRNWNWRPNITAEYENFLTVQGWNDLKYLAKNYQAIFPDILDNIYAQDKFLFRHTKTQRTEASYKAFVEGLFGENAYNHIPPPAQPEKDMLLKVSAVSAIKNSIFESTSIIISFQPYEMCPAWQKNSEKNKNVDSEVYKFEESQEYQKMLSDVSARLGFKFTLSEKQIKNIFDMCRYEQAWDLDRPSAWCTVRTEYT